MKYTTTLIFIILFFISCSNKNITQDININQGFYILDTSNEDTLTENFKMINIVFDNFGNKKDVEFSLDGLFDLNISGSSQFSQNSLFELISMLRETTNNQIYIVDLREETHGFVSGNAISFYKTNNWANIGKNKETIISEEINFFKELNSVQKIDVYKIDKNKKTVDKMIIIDIDSALTEQELLKSIDIEYLRLTVTNCRKPQNKQIEDFVNFYRKLPQNSWLHFHSDSENERVAIFMLMVDILKNAKNVSLKDIVARQAYLTEIDLFQKDKKDKDLILKNKFFDDKVEFIKQFYEYAMMNDDNFKTSWSKFIEKINK